jgi:hypothetical protein
MAICMKKQSGSYLWSFEEQKSCAVFVMPGFVFQRIATPMPD